MNLISSIAYKKTLKNIESHLTYRVLRDKYDSLLERTLNLGQFIACDLKGNALKKPKGYDAYINWEVLNPKFEEYQQAKQRVIFKGFKVDLDLIYDRVIYLRFKDFNIFFTKEGNDWKIEDKYSTIESLVDLNIELNDKAL